MYGIGVGIVLAISYWVAFSVFAALGTGGVVAPMLAAWAPNLLVRRGRRLFAADRENLSAAGARPLLRVFDIVDSDLSVRPNFRIDRVDDEEDRVDLRQDRQRAGRCAERPEVIERNLNAPGHLVEIHRSAASAAACPPGARSCTDRRIGRPARAVKTRRSCITMAAVAGITNAAYGLSAGAPEIANRSSSCVPVECADDVDGGIGCRALLDRPAAGSAAVVERCNVRGTDASE